MAGWTQGGQWNKKEVDRFQMCFDDWMPELAEGLDLLVKERSNQG